MVTIIVLIMEVMVVVKSVGIIMAMTLFIIIMAIIIKYYGEYC